MNSLIAGRSRDEFVRSLGYWKRIERGRHRFDLWMDDGDGHDKILSQIAAAYPEAEPELQAAVSATRKVKAAEREAARKEAVKDIEERARQRFKSFLWVRTEDGAHSFFSAMGERQLKVLWMGEGFQRLSDEEQLRAVQKRIGQHHGKTQSYPGFGAILGYTWARTFDSSVEFDTNGTIVDENGDQLLLPEVWLELHPPCFCP